MTLVEYFTGDGLKESKQQRLIRANMGQTNLTFPIMPQVASADEELRAQEKAS